MPIDLSVALGAELPEVGFEWSASDVALYHLAVGAAADPVDRAGLTYVDDLTPKVLPSFATVAASFHATEAPKVSFPGVDIDLAKWSTAASRSPRTARSPRRERPPPGPRSPRSRTRDRRR